MGDHSDKVTATPSEPAPTGLDQAGSDDAARARATAALLVALLTSPPYQQRWTRLVQRRRGDGVHQGAIAHVLASHLWDSGQAPESDVELPRRMKDTVSRALNGRALPPRVLQLFVDAFGFPDPVVQELWTMRVGRARGSSARYARFPSTATVVPDYRTRALFERHFIGADGLPQEHRTIQIIEAKAPMTEYLYRFDTAAVAVEVIRGGSCGAVEPCDMEGLSQVRIELDGPLRAGEIAALEYRTFFAYAAAPPKEFRRGARRRIDAVTLGVQFHPDACPTAIWFGEWDALDAHTPARSEQVRLKDNCAVERFLDHIEGGIAGFWWE